MQCVSHMRATEECFPVRGSIRLSRVLNARAVTLPHPRPHAPLYFVPETTKKFRVGEHYIVILQ